MFVLDILQRVPWYGYVKENYPIQGHIVISFVMLTYCYYSASEVFYAWQRHLTHRMTHWPTRIVTVLLKHQLVAKLLIAAVITISFGIAKEVYDARTPEGDASLFDLACDTAGIAFALFVCWVLHRYPIRRSVRSAVPVTPVSRAPAGGD